MCIRDRLEVPRPGELAPPPGLHPLLQLAEVPPPQDGGVSRVHGALHRVLQLADVARPVVIHQQVHGAGGHPLDDHAELVVEPVDKVVHKQGQILLPLPQGGGLDADDVEEMCIRDSLLGVYETESYERGLEEDGRLWGSLFTLVRYEAADYESLLAYGTEPEAFARDADGRYYSFTDTDVYKRQIWSAPPQLIAWSTR